MKIEPIPNELLGDDIVVLKPDEDGWTELNVSNVRAERIEAIDSGYPYNPREKTKLTVWYDFTNSSPKTDIACGMRISFGGEIFDIVNVKLLRAVEPHHLKITAVKLGENSQNT